MGTFKNILCVMLLLLSASLAHAQDVGGLIDSLAKATDAVANNTYPSPPGRVENLVTKGKPSGLVQTFIIWILTDGQKYVPEAGFVQLTPDLLAEALAKVK